jgi:hypothetical protein
VTMILKNMKRCDVTHPPNQNTTSGGIHILKIVRNTMKNVNMGMCLISLDNFTRRHYTPVVVVSY